MRFKSSTIQPGGRLSYGHYMAAGNVTSSVVKTAYYGNDTTTSIGGDTGGGNQDEDTTGFYMFLSKESCEFDAQKLAISAQTDTIQVIGYKENQRVPTYVMALDQCVVVADDTTGESAGLTTPANYGITGIPNTGLTVSVSNNGTTATTITVTVDSTIQGEGGSLYFPCNVILSTGSEMGDDPVLWYNRQSKCERIDFEYSYTIERGSPSSSYSLQLTNDSAGINSDIDGNVLSGATRPQCTAELYFGTQKITSGVSFDITTPQAAAVSGLGINHTSGALLYDGAAAVGELFGFEGTALDITFIATYSGFTFTKIMTITKQYPGVDGTGATTRWIVPSVSVIKVDPNLNNNPTPSSVTAKVMKQVNDQQPEEDNSTTMYWGWDTQTPGTAYTGAITVVVAGHDNLVLGLKNSGGTFYELETIPLLEEGTNGTNGTSGSSVYRLDLSNENASINCDSSGTLLPGAVRPQCTATLYYGQDEVSDAYYYFYENYGNGISIDHTGGTITVSNSFTWTGTSIGIVVMARTGGSNGTPRGSATFTLSKNYPGANGEPAVSYWLSPSASAIRVDASGNTSPSTITCEAFKQVGDNTPEKLSYNGSPTIYWGYNTYDPPTRYTGQTITVDSGQTYICFQLYDYIGEAITYDLETIPILHDGKDGEDGQGRNGAAILGPTEWTSAMERRWHSGNDTAIGTPTEEDRMFLDIIVRVVNGEKVYYYCNTSYTQRSNTSWSSVSQYWTEADEQFDFVAAKLILASGASIDFLTGNEIYLRDGSGNITAGAAGGNGISFWAGSSTPGNAPFQVDYQGNITAKSGTFSGYIQMKYIDMSELQVQHSSNSSYYTYYLDTRAYVIANGGSIGETKTMILPRPTSSLNGFVYYFLVIGKRLGTYTDTETMSCFVEVSGGTADILDYVYLPYGNVPFKKVGMFGGKYQFVCADVDGSYKWILTEATGGAQLVNNSTSKYRCFRPVYGFEGTSGTPQVKNITTVSSTPQDPDINTMYLINS